MNKIKSLIYRKYSFLFFFILFSPSLLNAGLEFDHERYISIDEIKPGMKGYALSVYSGINIEKFPIEVVSVVKNESVGKNAIFVMGTGARFIHTGPVEGCSGSPVYINGKIAGALAFGWSYSKDPLYGVTPINQMIRVSDVDDQVAKNGGDTEFKLDISDSISLDVAYKSFLNTIKPKKSLAANGFGEIGFPMVTSLSRNACAKIEWFSSVFGNDLVSSDMTSSGSQETMKASDLKPGAVLAIPLVSGDIKMAAIGTVTDVVGDNVLAFGHAFTGRGSVNLPMATGFVHTVVANNVSSFKYAQASRTIGALKSDESTAVWGKIGEVAPTIPISISLNRFDVDEPKTYNCKIAVDSKYSPILVQAIIAGVVFERGGLPVYHNLKYSAKIDFDNSESLEFNNITTDSGIYQLLKDVIGSVIILSNNPYHQSVINNIDIKVDLDDKSKMATLWNVDISKTKLKASETINVSVTIDTFGSKKLQYDFDVKIPDNAPKGNYMLFVSGRDYFLEFQRQNLPYLYKADNFYSMIKIIKRLAKERSDDIYCSLIYSKKGVSLATAPLYGLPVSKQVSLIDPRHGMPVKKIGKWLTSTKSCGYVVDGMRKIKIEVIE